MASEDVVHLHASSNSELKDTVDGCTTDGIFTMEDLGHPKEENQCADSTDTKLQKDPSSHPPVQELVESVSVSQFSEVNAIKRLRDVDDSTGVNGSVDHNKEDETHVKQGVKRLQEECGNIESSVHVVFSSLPRSSKRKLEELLSNWSDWHAKHCASAKDTTDSLESGEETYFPALHVGLDKPSTVSFSMDVNVSKRQCKESVSCNHECSSLYDRGFAVGLVSNAVADEDIGVDLREAPRCFNCGSYNHPLSGCTKPVNKSAVNSARKEFQSKKNQNGSPRVPTRYYQDSPRGKYDGLVPGALSVETRKLMGLGELDPPPWLNRMRELGYPPGYLDLQEEDQPSGIAIFGGDETQVGDVRNDPPLDPQKTKKKEMIDFPGINAPIPKNADQNLWATPRGPAIPDNRRNFTQDPIAIRNFQEAYELRKHFDGPSPSFGFGSPPVSQYPRNYYPSEPFSPVGVQIPQSPRYGGPYNNYNYNYNHGSL
ncbi:hypothetical protein RND81_02G202400 [Saponaria officinalis]|uniref:PSP proline-rich domain-containing protein n=1 Tax=Saponaria officinalis TaxID=3572 RepID=A0AAW1MZ78_SAPOF